jgi:predicted O-methyltransferase YrrM
MTEQLWTSVDQYYTEALVKPDDALDAALRDSDAAGLPPINVTPNEGKLLHLMARICGARSILEIGTLGGYSTIWLARALPDGGHLVTLEAEPRYAEVARANIARAGLADRVEVRVGRALDTLPQLEADGLGQFDLVFIDADKPSNPDYVEWAMKITRPGSVIIVDNVVRGGAVADPGSEDSAVIGVRRMNELIAADQRLTATAIQTVGSKGLRRHARRARRLTRRPRGRGHRCVQQVEERLNGQRCWRTSVGEGDDPPAVMRDALDVHLSVSVRQQCEAGQCRDTHPGGDKRLGGHVVVGLEGDVRNEPVALAHDEQVSTASLATGNPSLVGEPGELTRCMPPAAPTARTTGPVRQRTVSVTAAWSDEVDRLVEQRGGGHIGGGRPGIVVLEHQRHVHVAVP